MLTLSLPGLITFAAITIFFFLIGSRPIIFHAICAILLGGFVVWSGKSLNSDSIVEWILFVVGLMLYWFGLVVVRIMLTRSVSLQMLAGYAHGETRVTTSEGIAGRLKDATHFGLVRSENDHFGLTLFGKTISFIVASSYFVLRIK